MGSGASRNLDTQQIEKLKQEVQGLKSEIKAKDVEMDRLSLMSLTDNPVFDFSGRTYKKLKVIGKGASAVCFLVERESDKTKFVVKQLMIPVEELAKKHGFADEVRNLTPTYLIKQQANMQPNTRVFSFNAGEGHVSVRAP